MARRNKNDAAIRTGNSYRHTLSLHDALPILRPRMCNSVCQWLGEIRMMRLHVKYHQDSGKKKTSCVILEEHGIFEYILFNFRKLTGTEDVTSKAQPLK